MPVLEKETKRISREMRTEKVGSRVSVLELLTSRRSESLGKVRGRKERGIARKRDENIFDDEEEMTKVWEDCAPCSSLS